MQLRKRSLKKIQDFNGVWTQDLGITGATLYELSYEATDVGSRSIVGSYVPVKETSAGQGVENTKWPAVLVWDLRQSLYSQFILEI